ncbi:hypothetical protein EAG_15198 [Camponotus floridanus]|uniref:Uncharacterized protein n=1 Tax=Camponotus floridanus TaxID=104421 RepID=E2ATL7_CAMFO|nr:hypothetical protein EAG_15198 [Camponotus floridanus]
MIRAWGNVIHMVEYIASANFSLMALSKLIATWYHSERMQRQLTIVTAQCYLCIC